MSDQYPTTPQPGEPGGYTPPPANQPPVDPYAGQAGAYPPPPPPPAYDPNAVPVAASAPAPGQVDLGAALSYGWRKFTANVAPFIVILLIAGGIAGVIYAVGIAVAAGLLAGADASNSSGLAVVAGIVGVVFMLLAVFAAMVVSMGLYRAALDTVRGVPVTIGSAFRRDGLGQFLTLYGIIIGAVLVLSIVLSFIPILGSILMFVVSLAVGLFTYFAPFLVLDKGMSAVDALKTNYSMAMSNIGQMILVVLVLGLVSGAGSIVCGIGAFVTVPLALIAGASIYLSLQGEPSAP